MKNIITDIDDMRKFAGMDPLNESVELNSKQNLQEGSSKGEYWGRRAKDSRVVKMKDSEAMKVIKRKAIKSSKDAPSDWLLVWWVPPEYVKAKEAKDRIEDGWIKPLWDWGKGSSNLKLNFDSVVYKEDIELDESHGSLRIGSNEKVVIQQVRDHVADYYKKKAAAPDRAHEPRLREGPIEKFSRALGSALKKDLAKAGAKLVGSVEASQGAKEILAGTPWRYIIRFNPRPRSPGNNDPRWREKEAATEAWDVQFKKDKEIIASFGLKGERGNPLGFAKVNMYGKPTVWWAERTLLPARSKKEDVELSESKARATQIAVDKAAEKLEKIFKGTSIVGMAVRGGDEAWLTVKNRKVSPVKFSMEAEKITNNAKWTFAKDVSQPGAMVFKSTDWLGEDAEEDVDLEETKEDVSMKELITRLGSL